MTCFRVRAQSTASGKPGKSTEEQLCHEPWEAWSRSNCALAVSGCCNPLGIRARDQSINQSCGADRKTGKLQTYSAMADCVNQSNARFERKGEARGVTAYTDIYQNIAGKRTAIARRADSGEMNEQQADAAFATLIREMDSEIGERASQYTRDRILANWKGTGSGYAPPDNNVGAATDNSALLRFSAGMLAPTRSGGLSEAISNGIYGAPPPPVYAPAPYPTQTICFRSGPNVICNTQ